MTKKYYATTPGNNLYVPLNATKKPDVFSSVPVTQEKKSVYYAVKEQTNKAADETSKQISKQSNDKPTNKPISPGETGTVVGKFGNRGVLTLKRYTTGYRVELEGVFNIGVGMRTEGIIGNAKYKSYNLYDPTVGMLIQHNEINVNFVRCFLDAHVPNIHPMYFHDYESVSARDFVKYMTASKVMKWMLVMPDAENGVIKILSFVSYHVRLWTFTNYVAIEDKPVTGA